MTVCFVYLFIPTVSLLLLLKLFMKKIYIILLLTTTIINNKMTSVVLKNNETYTYLTVTTAINGKRYCLPFEDFMAVIKRIVHGNQTVFWEIR